MCTHVPNGQKVLGGRERKTQPQPQYHIVSKVNLISGHVPSVPPEGKQCPFFKGTDETHQMTHTHTRDDIARHIPFFSPLQAIQIKEQNNDHTPGLPTSQRRVRRLPTRSSKSFDGVTEILNFFLSHIAVFIDHAQRQARTLFSCRGFLPLWAWVCDSLVSFSCLTRHQMLLFSPLSCLLPYSLNLPPRRVRFLLNRFGVCLPSSFRLIV